MQCSTDIDGGLFDSLRPRLIAISRRIVGSQAEAEDVVQDCYFKWHAAERDALATPAAWLTTVVQRQSIDRLRQRGREEAAARMAAEPELAASPEEALLRRAEVGAALAALRQLTRLERMALVLHEVCECGHADIAAVLGTSVVNARQYLARARRRLREGRTVEEKLCRELVLRFQAAINGGDVPAVVSLLAEEQPVSVLTGTVVRMGGMRAANDGVFMLAA